MAHKECTQQTAKNRRNAPEGIFDGLNRGTRWYPCSVYFLFRQAVVITMGLPQLVSLPFSTVTLLPSRQLI